MATVQEEASLSLAAPGGWKANLRGMDTKLILFTILVAVFCGAILLTLADDRLTDKQERRTFYEQHKITQALLSSVITNQKAMMDQLANGGLASREDLGEITYILTLSQDRRDNLKLEMPQTLRKKLNATQGIK